MKKHTYRAQKVNNMNWQQVKEQTIGETLVLAVDVAKVQQYALLTNQEHTQTWLMQWSHLEYTSYLIEQLKALEVPIFSFPRAAWECSSGALRQASCED